MTSRPVPDHGTYARANGSPGYRLPCYCDLCVIAKRKARKRSKINRQLGRSAFIDASMARTHITLLHKTMSWSSLAAATGIDDRSLCLLYSGQRTRISRTSHVKIMAVRVPKAPDAWLYVDATGTVRRIRALMAIGHSGRVLADAIGTDQAQIHRVSGGQQPTVRRNFAARVEAAYTRLAFRPAPDNRFTRRTRSTAAAKNWHGPLAWDDDIDDPNAVPEVDEPARVGGRRRGESPDPARVMRLTVQGLSAEQIAAELGVHKRTVVRARGRARTAAAAAAAQAAA